MRLLVTTDVIGGVWSYTEELVGALRGRGHEVVLAALGGPPTPVQQAWAAAHPDVEFVSLDFPLEWMPEPEPGVGRSAAALAELAARAAADAIHLNQFVYGACDLGAPKLVVAHSDVVSWWHVVKAGAPPEDAWFGRYRSWVAAGLAGADARVAPSGWMAQRVEELYGVAGVRVVHNARSAGGFLRPVGGRPARVVAVGRLWDEAKGFGDLAAAAPRLARVAEVVVAGEVRHPGGGRDFPADGPGPRWAGRLSGEAIGRLLGGAAVYAATSRYEPFGLAPLEAALAGCALVASDIPTFRELWDGCALFYPPGDAAALAAAVRSLLADEPRRRALAAAGQARALERFTPARMVQEYEALYRELAVRRAGRAREEAAPE
ncbi:MAG TPA: glycosyltransferase family 4 protein [Longimicrobiales bacterium]|nr:glycosyltransferase family 4 protein [Longimicrobiales bacterium]